MDIIKVRYEPFLFHLYCFGFFAVMCVVMCIVGFIKNWIEGSTENSGLWIVFSLPVAITLGLLIGHFSMREEIVAEISEEGIKICDDLNFNNDFIKWEDIVSWEYHMSGRMSTNRLKINTNSKAYEIRGFSRRILIAQFDKYVLFKRKDLISELGDYLNL